MSVRSSQFAPFVLLISLAVAVASLGIVAHTPPAVASLTWQVTFRDDFSGSGLPDPALWQLTLGTSYPGGPENFGTGEIQTMTADPSNVDVRNGNLYITPQRGSSGAWTLPVRSLYLR